MVQKLAPSEVIKCFIVLTNTSRQAINEHFSDEHAFFNLQNAFDVYIEKLSIEQNALNLTIYFDNKKNKKLANKFDERVVIMDCIFDLKNGLVAKSFRTKGKHTPVATNRRAHMKIRFVASRISGHTYSEKFIKTIAELPVAQERYDYVNKRITSWEGYLKVLYKNASFDDIETQFDSVRFNSDYSILSMKCRGIQEKEWKNVKGLSARIQGYKQDIGEVVKANRSSQTIEIELRPNFVKLARNDEFDFHSENISFSNASTTSQLKRLLNGFERLKDGLAANASLENILFEDNPNVVEPKKDIEIEFHNNLNEYQRGAVIGAIAADDLYVIQGPPGTGKTTVISEICYQNAKAGLKTLIASQSNLAVDNALSRLLSNKDIRILRYGRTESIEEEGKKFIEENVANYWKTQTYDAITNEINQHASKEHQLKTEIEQCRDEIISLKEKQKKLEEEIERKKQAKVELAELTEQIVQLKKQLSPLKKERDHTELALEKLRSSFEKLTKELDELNEQIRSLGSIEQINEEIQYATKEIAKSDKIVEYARIQENFVAAKKQLEDVKSQLSQIEATTTNLDSTIQQIHQMKKIHDIEQFIETHSIRKGYVLNRLFSDMETIHENIVEFKTLKDISGRLEKAIEYSKKTLGITVDLTNLPQNQSYSLQEIDEFLTKLSYAFARKQVTPLNGTRSIQGLYLRKLSLAKYEEKYRALVDESLLVFRKIKEEVEDQIKQKSGVNQSVVTSLKEKETQFNQTTSSYQQQLDELTKDIGDTSFIPTNNELQSVRDMLQQKITKLEEDQEKVIKIEETYQKKKQDEERVNLELTVGEEALQKITEELKQINAQGIQLEKNAETLQQITKQNPEAELEKTTEQIANTEKEIEKLTAKIDMLPITKTLQNEWQALLEQASEHDLDEIRKLYVKNANVIGTTCVASANKEFMDNYPTFDVVIIDEVSKATPPELLLPMLKGKKIVLVGDHHQLPPLIGDETLEETLEAVIKESDTFEEKRELEKLLEESLFERLYKNLPSTNKKMLGIQYRMHEKIMQTIAPFYQNGNESLHCGLTDSDAMRDHKLNCHLVKRNEHLLWYDIPNRQGFFEERMKEGASLFNESELTMIREMLIELNYATEKAKVDGSFNENDLKSVGVISFYAEQVKRINQLVQELNLEHLHIRTGSVDKFQGMEMDVILLSMVRNNDNKHGDIGFAKDYRRLNVALSRARELLVLIGSSEMFTKRPKKEETREMYRNLLNVVKDQKGYREFNQNALA
ncbi:AAA domain-containing protein [Ureibacillus composti]|nr:AAA domain-containing protein [Ureibacillus composti]